MNFYDESELIEIHAVKVGHEVGAPLSYAEDTFTDANGELVEFPFTVETTGILNVHKLNIVPLIPAMTGYTTPSGEVSATYEYTGRQAWWAFDGGIPVTSNPAHFWYCDQYNAYLQYTFDNPVNIMKIELMAEVAGLIISYSLDGINFTEMTRFSSSTPYQFNKYEIPVDTTNIKAIRFTNVNQAGQRYSAIGKIQAYGITM